jgi:uncharacterized protein YjiS (DUF1127 family)
MRSPIGFVRGLRTPEGFHGTGITEGFFEGWYVKLVSSDTAQRWAVIPGIFRGIRSDADRIDEAFVQVLDGSTGRSWYHPFPIDEFFGSPDRFHVQVGGNTFDASGVTLDLPEMKGRVGFVSELDPWPVTWRSPGIMGWYGLVPFMECYHGIVSFGHDLSGALTIGGEEASFEGGRGYLEKDWGRAFPAGYVWLHSNHIDADPTASLVASVALIPWIRTTFRGFIVGLRHGGQLYRWATYNRSREELLRIDDRHVQWSLIGPDGRLTIRAERVRGGLLHVPMRDAMHKRVEETMDGTVSIRHESAEGEVLLEGDGTCACMEVFGDIERLLAVDTR